MPCLGRYDVKARHSISAREISSPQRNMVQMKICRKDILPKMARLPLFDGCPPEETTEILVELMGSIHGFAPGEVIVHECESAVSMVAVISGVASVWECGLTDDVRHLVQCLRAGGMFGSTFPALKPQNYPGMLVAEEVCEVLFLNVAAIRRMMERGMRPRFLSNLYAAACTQGFYAWRKLMLLSCYEIADRVLLYLKWRKEDGLPSPVKFKYGELAEYLGVNRTALYRAIAKLRKSGKIRIEDDTLALA